MLMAKHVLRFGLLPVLAAALIGTCAYQAADDSFDVSVLITGASAGDQLLKELRESAADSPGATVEKLPVGDTAHGYATARQASAVMVAGGKSYYVEVSHTSGPPGDPRGEVLKILKKVAG